MDLRQDQLKTWAFAQFLENGPLFDGTHYSNDDGQWSSVSGDASFRRYFRLVLGGVSYILVDAPPEHENSEPFVRIAKDWKAQGINTPEVKVADLAQGFMLLEDFGDHLCLQGLSADNCQARYQQCLDELSLIQRASPQGLPAYDEALLAREIDLFTDWFIGELLGVKLNDAQASSFATLKQQLIDAALAQPQVPVHRDYHSRNLLMLAPEQAQALGHKVGVIDFQDAVHGPVTYDLVSLLRDCYVRWPDEQVAQWLCDYAQKARAGEYGSLAEVFATVDDNTLLQWCDDMATQRHLKAVGIFARLCIRDGKPTYLQDIPRVLGYILSVCQRRGELPEWQALEALMVEVLIPAMEQSSHYTAESLAELKQQAAQREQAL